MTDFIIYLKDIFEVYDVKTYIRYKSKAIYEKNPQYCQLNTSFICIKHHNVFAKPSQIHNNESYKENNNKYVTRKQLLDSTCESACPCVYLSVSPYFS